MSPLDLIGYDRSTRVPKATNTEVQNAPKRSPCPIAGTLDVLGDRWSLLVVRDLLFRDRHTFGELQDSPEGIATNILAERLKRLEAAGIIAKERYQDRPPRYAYSLTKKGRSLRPVLIAMVRWANTHVPGTVVPPAEALKAKPKS